MEETKGFAGDEYPGKIVAYGAEAIEKKVGRTGGCGRVYLPGSWAGKKVIIIRLNKEETR